jgi:DtxR family transcriptional regulator, Mn-dependent transcriptional regulator
MKNKNFAYLYGMSKNTYTRSEENHLKAIYSLSLTAPKKISLTLISEVLDINPASVIDMVGKLAEKKLILYDKTKGARLTDKGYEIAVSIVRKHRLWESFLLEKLGYGWDEVHDIAEQLEHIENPQLADKLDKYLGFPAYDPHGDPIPRADGATAVTYKTKLSEVPVGKSCEIMAVKDANPTFLQYLEKLDLHIGAKITVIEKIPFDDSVVIMIGNNNKTTVSKAFANNLLVRE